MINNVDPDFSIQNNVENKSVNDCYSNYIKCRIPVKIRQQSFKKFSLFLIFYFENLNEIDF